MKIIVISLYFICISLFAHPVSYTIDLKVSYNKVLKESKIICTSNSKNKCGLYSFNLLDKNKNILKTKRFPFLKDFTSVKLEKKPFKMIFFLRKVPEHQYSIIFE